MLQIRFNEEKDKDILKFLNIQSNKTLLVKLILRKLIKKYGYVDIVKVLDLEDVNI